ncbi:MULTISPECIES: hypothetical protein [unclassified Streptomyces]|uniref:hypothetical protein n=1 Tax=unclassified Streptomyces TaxID=2593676 RepID=UPI00211B8F53|nr:MULTISPECIES: hypothetical protein [unclassified Streptomyces]
MLACIGLLVALAGCGSNAAGYAGASSDNETVQAPAPVGTNSITVLVIFVGGPADGRTERLPLSQLAGVAISGVTYRSRPGPPPEVKSTPQGLAQVMRPV